MEATAKIETRPEQPYLAIRKQLKMIEISSVLPPLIPEVLDWLKMHHIEPAGPVFFNYLEMNGDHMTAEVGVPIKTVHAGDDHVIAGVFPAGEYAVYTHMGNYTGIPQAHQDLQLWANKKGLKLQDPCIEFYPTDPAIETNPNNWQTDILRKVKSSS